jgi:hypothetical protein
VTPRGENRGGWDNAFAALREQYIEEPPGELEEFLRMQMRRRRHWRGARIWVVGAAAAALAMLALLPGSRKHAAPPFPKPPVAELRREVPAPLTPEAAASETTRPVRAAARHAQKTKRPTATAEWADAGGFLAIPYAAPFAPSEQIDVYRVELPRTVFAHYGLPVRAGNTEAPVPAEVAVGSDGVVRAIRFVR